MKRPGVAVAVAVAAGLLGVAMLGGRPDGGPPLDPRSDEPLGTSALVALLSRLDARVELSAGLPDEQDDVALVLDDRLDPEQSERVLAWVRAGGTLVVTDPASGLAPPTLGGLEAALADAPGRGVCTIRALDEVAAVDTGTATRFDTDGATGSCFGSRDFAFVVARALGEGTVVAVGGAAFATNERLDRDDNAVLAAAVLAPRAGTRVRFVDAPIPVGGGDRSLYELISDGVRRGGLQMGVAFLLYAAWRAVRLGRPVLEEQPVEIAGAELVSAAGRLLERGRAPGDAAEVLRSDLRRAIRNRLGLPAGVSPASVAAVAAERLGVDAGLATAALGDRSVTTDTELVAVARAVASIHQEVFR